MASRSKHRSASALKVLDRLNQQLDTPTDDESRVKPKAQNRESSRATEGEGPASPPPVPPEEVVDTRTGDEVYLSPSDIVPWSMANRLFFNPVTLDQLKVSIDNAGQKQPALVRPNAAHADDPDTQPPYELIYGAQRLRAATELGIRLLCRVRTLDDRQAAIEMDAENRARADLGVYERARDYANWIKQGLFESPAEIADETGLARSSVARYLRIAALPVEVGAAFPDPTDLSFSFAYDLTVKMSDNDQRREQLKAVAARLADRDAASLSTQTRKRYLLDAVTDHSGDNSDQSQPWGDGSIQIRSGSGYTLGSANVTRKGQIRIQMRQLAEPSQARAIAEEITLAITHIVDKHREDE